MNFSATLRYILQSKSLSLQERINKVTETDSTLQRIRRDDVKLFHKLKKDEIIDELHQRKGKFSCNLNKKDLLAMLEFEMHRIQRLSVILCKSSEAFDMRNCNIPDYAMFTAMKWNTNNSSNFHPNNGMKNIIIRAEARSTIGHTSRKSNQSYL